MIWEIIPFLKINAIGKFCSAGTEKNLQMGQKAAGN
jgi:hypothetical protein